MPATYSFSLNLKKDRDIIELLEDTKNKSLLIRQSLHAKHKLAVYKEYTDRLERMIRKYTDELEWQCPSFTQMLEHCYFLKAEERLLTEPVLQEVHNSFQEQE
jgi:hypothetical protein